MKAEVINPFLNATTTVFHDLLKVPLVRGRMLLRSSPLPSHEVAIYLTIKGKHTGTVVYSMNFDAALKIAHRLVPNLKKEELINEYRDIIGEVSNMITGNALQIFIKQGTDLDLSVPMVLDIRTRKPEVHEVQTVCIYFYSRFGLLETLIAMK